MEESIEVPRTESGVSKSRAAVDRSPSGHIEAWVRVQADLRASAGKSAFDLWFSQLEPLRLSGEVLYLTGPSHVVTWVERRYEDLLARSLRCLEGEVVEIRLLQREAAETAAGREDETHSGACRSRKKTFERFVIGPGNRIAHGASLAVAESPGEAYNPLFLHGNPGLGKSHLLSAIAEYIDRTNPELRVHSTTAESFTADFIQAVQSKGIEAFKDRYRRVDVLLLDDVQFLEGKARTADEFFHTFNALHMAGAQIVLSADRMPSELSTLADRLTERFEWGLVVDIDGPDLATRKAFLQTFCANEGVEIDPESADLLANYSLASIRAVEGALTRVLATASLGGRELTPGLVESVLGLKGLGDQLAEKSVVTISEIKSLVSELFSVTADELTSGDRSERVSSARQVAMSLARDFTTMSLPAIAQALGRKDHSTILHGIARTEERAESDPSFRSLLQACRSRLSGDRS